MGILTIIIAGQQASYLCSGGWSARLLSFDKGNLPPMNAIVSRGLSEAEARSRLAVDGPNELPRPDRRTVTKIILEVLREPMFALLVGGGAIYLALGDLKDAFVLLAFASLSVVITVVQESRTERVLEALRELTSPRALVIRDGERKRIAGRDVVRGDLIVLSEGDRVPADAVLVEATGLAADESLLTGESMPVTKTAHVGDGEPKPCRPGGDNLSQVFSGSLVVRGTGVAEVLATGRSSEIGKIGQALSSVQTASPRLQAQIRALVRTFAVFGGAVSIVAVLLYGMLRGGWLEAALAGIAIGMSMLPEEFPVVLTVFMAMGARRISHARVLTRRAAAIEALGSATVLCTDKTGTLTENRMSIAEVRLRDGGQAQQEDLASGHLPQSFLEIIQYGVLASARTPFDPMEKAFHQLAEQTLGNEQRQSTAEWELTHSYALSPTLLAMTQVWRPGATAETFVVAAKGAPEAIFRLCDLSQSARAALATATDEMARKGQRILGIAKAAFSGPLPAAQDGFAFEFLGLVGLADPLRPGVPAAVKECTSAGIRVLMVTGDYPATARAIANKAGFSAGDVISGEELLSLDDEALKKRIATTTVFARVMPEQKLRIVNVLKNNAEIVAMTGDGVNDAPSLKAAHIGIAMGGRGTDVAREASSIVLLNDDFGSIVKAIRLGRRIFDNLRKAISFILAVHVPIAGLALLPLILGYPILLGPMHIAFLEMIIDPVCSLVFEAESEEPNVMRRPPRDPSAPLLAPMLIVGSVLEGVLVLAVVATLFVIGFQRGLPESEVRALSFVALVLSIISLIIVNRSSGSSLLAMLNRPNPKLGWILAAVVLMLAVVLQSPFARDLFRFDALQADDLLITGAAGLLVLISLELAKGFVANRMEMRCGMAR